MAGDIRLLRLPRERPGARSCDVLQVEPRSDRLLRCHGPQTRQGGGGLAGAAADGEVWLEWGRDIIVSGSDFTI